IVSTNRMLVGRSDGFDLIEPCVAPDGAGGVYLAWRDEAGGRIYAARYDVSMNQTLAPFVINDSPSQNFAGPFDIDNFGSSRLAVVWEDYGTENNIKLRLFNSSGSALTGAIQINDAPANAQWLPTVAFDVSGRMGVAWEDYRNGNADIFFQLVNADGALSGANLGIIEGAYDDSAQFMPEVAYSSRDGFAISWLDRRNGAQRVYLQRYITGVGLSGSNKAISLNDTSVAAWDLAADVDETGNLRLAWTASDGIDTVKIQKFTTNFAVDGGAAVINKYNAGSRWETAISHIVSGKFLCCWTDLRDGNHDIYLQLVSSANAPLLAQDQLINDDAAGAPSTEPDVTILPDESVLAVFTDARNDAGDIYVQKISSGGAKIGTNVKVNTDNPEALQNEPKVASSVAGAMMVWNDGRVVNGISGQRIFGRFASTDGSMTEDDFLISDSTNVAVKRNPNAAVAGNGAALVAWVDYRNGAGDIYGRHFNADGSPSGNIFRISTASDIDNDDISIDVDNSGIFTVVWLSRGYAGGPTVIAARYANNGSLLNRIAYVSDQVGVEFIDIAAAVSTNGNVYIIWEGRGLTTRLYMTVISSSGTIIKPGTNMFSSDSDYPMTPDIDVDEVGHVITTWIETEAIDRQLFYQIFNNNFASVGKHSVTFTLPEFMISPAVAARNLTAWFGWVDPRSNGLNVYATAIDYISTDITDDNEVLLPVEFELYQNYPNPFNPETWIDFSIPSRSRVNISVYNMLGQMVAVLTDKVYDAGKHNVVWNGCDVFGNHVSSGIYFYKMKVGELAISRKMLLVK
ncbi:MAG: T9SS type A sorting domain-containing protein, partial [Candidatus Zixiibacteriota bacterium]